jgi:hypothetical protein
VGLFFFPTTTREAASYSCSKYITKLQTRNRNGITTFNGWTLTEQPAKQLNIIETSNAQRDDWKMTSEASYIIGTDLTVYHDDDDDDELQTVSYRFNCYRFMLDSI